MPRDGEQEPRRDRFVVGDLTAAARGTDPLKNRAKASQSVFLLQGEMLLSYEGGGTLVVVGGSEETRQALNRQKPAVGRSNPTSILIVVVLPAPFGPRKP